MIITKLIEYMVAVVGNTAEGTINKKNTTFARNQIAS